MLSEIFWTSFCTTVVAALVFGIRACLRSKCDYIEFCCIKIHRQVELESGSVDDIQLSHIYNHNQNNEEVCSRR